MLLKIDYYLYFNNQTVNSYANNVEIISASSKNRLFGLKLYKKLKKLYNISFIFFAKATISYIINLIQIWHKYWKYSNYANLKRFDNT